MKSLTKSTDINTLTPTKLYWLLAKPKFAADYIVRIARTGDDSKLRRAVDDLITALCIRHERVKTRQTLQKKPKTIQNLDRTILPNTNDEILREFDRLVRTRNCNAFARNAADTKYSQIRWDIVGDNKRNWLFVVASNPNKNKRFAMITDDPGGWAIGGQVFGMDAETSWVALNLAKRLLKKHRAELI